MFTATFDHSASFEEIHSEFSGLVESWIRRRIGNPEHAEEIVQEVFLKLHYAWDRYDPSRPLLAWLRTLTRNAMSDWYRKQESGAAPASTIAWLDEDPTSYERLPSDLPPPDARLERRAERRAIFAAIQELPELPRRVMWLRLAKELSYREIAARLGVSLDSAKCAMYRARHELSDKIADA